MVRICIKIFYLFGSFFQIFLKELIYLNSTGIFNLAIGKSLLKTKLVEWLNYYNKNSCRKLTPKKFNKDRFYLSNKSYLEKLTKVNLTDLEKRM